MAELLHARTPCSRQVVSQNQHWDRYLRSQRHAQHAPHKLAQLTQQEDDSNTMTLIWLRERSWTWKRRYRRQATSSYIDQSWTAVRDSNQHSNSLSIDTLRIVGFWQLCHWLVDEGKVFFIKKESWGNLTVCCSLDSGIFIRSHFCRSLWPRSAWCCAEIPWSSNLL